MIAAAQATAHVFPLAALRLFAEKPHLRHRLPTAALHRGFALSISNTVTGLPGCLYDSGTWSCCSGKERDTETGLDYFGARYMSSAQGRFTSPDPLYFQKEMLEDPQRWNLYSYTRNNPLRYVDPSGQEIELLGDEEHRKKALEALKNAVGTKAGQYLKESLVKGTDRYIVEVTDQRAFGSSNSVAGELGAIINAKNTVGLGVVGGNERLPDGTTLSGEGQPGLTGNLAGLLGTSIGSKLNVYVLDPKEAYSPYSLPGRKMSDGIPSDIPDIGLVTAHELGHARARMTGGYSVTSEASNDAALRLENKVRVLRDPNAATRTRH